MVKRPGSVGVAHRQDPAPEPHADHAERPPEGSFPDRGHGQPLQLQFAEPVSTVSSGAVDDEPAPAAARRAAVIGDACAHRGGRDGLRRRRAALVGDVVGRARQLVPRRLGDERAGLPGARQHDHARPRRSRSPSRSPCPRRWAARCRRSRRRPRARGTRSATARSSSSPPASATDSARTSASGSRTASGCSAPSRAATRGAAGRCPQGTTLRLQQLLAVLGYLPLRFHYAGTGPGPSTANQLDAAVKPPAGKLQLALPEHPERAREHVGARHVRRDDQGRDHDVRGPARHDRRRSPRAPGLERADHRRGAGQEQHVRLHVRARERGQLPRPSRRGTTARPSSPAPSTPASRRRRPRRACSPCSSTRCR